MICNSGLFLLLLVRTYRSCVHIIKLPIRLSNMATLKIVIHIKFQNRFRVSNRRRSSFPTIRYLRMSAVFQTAITIAMVIKIISMSRRQKAEQASCKICNQASTRFTRFGPLKLGFCSNVQAVQNNSAP
jgi:hypothetical protein